MSIADKAINQSFIDSLKKALWKEVKPDVLAAIYQAIDENPDQPLFSIKHTFWRIPISVTLRLGQIKPVIEWALGPDPRGPEAA